MYNVNGADGGSGGGAAYNGATGGATTQAPFLTPFQPYCFGTAGGDGHPSPNVYNGAGGGGAGGAGEFCPLMVVEVPGKITVFVSPLFPGMNATFLTAIGTNGKFAQGGGGGTYDPNTGSASGYAGGGGGGGGGPRNDISPSTEKLVLITLDLVGEWEMVETELLFSNTLSMLSIIDIICRLIYNEPEYIIPVWHFNQYGTSVTCLKT